MEEYSQMMLLEEMESLRETLDELGCTTRREVEVQLAAKGDPSVGDVLDWMDQIGVGSSVELDQRIAALHAQLDQMD
ncbi:MAG: hypothetical protein DLM69_07770 [Candidatus Chloroheliales bacterium]|nr:MAG: hypothetical protein DLM69_07770 [Chloroflexota bacterium]